MTAKHPARRIAAAIAAGSGLMLSACATDDPLFWEGVAVGAEAAVLIAASQNDCYGYRGCRYGRYDPPPRHRGRPHHRHDRRDRDHRPHRGGHGKP